MLSPIVQRRPFPTTLVGLIGVALYAWLFHLAGESSESHASDRIAEEEPAPSIAVLQGDPSGLVVEGGISVEPSTSLMLPAAAPETTEVSPFEPARELALPAIVQPLAVEPAGDPELLAEILEPDVVAVAEQEEGQDLRLPLENLRGRLVDGLGQALEAWEVQLTLPAGSRRAQTSHDGAFEFSEVEKGEYSFFAWNPEDLRWVRTQALGTSMSSKFEPLICDPPPLVSLLEAKLRTSTGRPLAGVLVTPVLSIPAGSNNAVVVFGKPTYSLDEGRLLIENVPSLRRSESDSTGIVFWVQGGGVFPALLPWSDGELIAEECAELIIEVIPSSKAFEQATHVLCRDGNGEALRMVQSGPKGMRGTPALALEKKQGSETKCLVPLSASELILAWKGAEREWVIGSTMGELGLSPDRPNRLRFR